MIDNNSFEQNIAQYQQAAQDFKVEMPEQAVNSNQVQPEPVQKNETTDQKAPESSKEYNFRMLRETAAEEERRRKEEERKRIELEKALSRAEDELRSLKLSARGSEKTTESDEELSDDDIPTWGQQKRYLQRLERAISQQQEEIRKERQQEHMKQAERQFRSDHPDAESVLSPEHIDALKRIYPHDFAGIVNHPDEYGKMKMAYNMIRRYGIVDSNETETRIQENLKKPRPGSVGNAQVSESSLGNVDNYGRRTLSESDRERMRELMAKARQNY